MENTNRNKKMVGLGRGLGALLQDSESVNSNKLSGRTPPYEMIGSMNEIDVNFIEANPYQPRSNFDQEALQELADSIRVQLISVPPTTSRCWKWL